MTEFVIGCTHFGHARIIELAKRPFADVTEMDRAMIDNWNSTVGKKDTVCHLGDVTWKHDRITSLMGMLNGNIVPIMGNHDPKGWPAPYMKEVKSGGVRVVLCHYPIEDWNGRFRGSVHLHCHTHQHDFVSAPGRGNVTVEAIGYTPMRLSEAVERLLPTREYPKL